MLACESQNIRLLDEVLHIHRISNDLHKKIEKVPQLLQTRRKGTGGSSLAFVAPFRIERQPHQRTDRKEALQQLAIFATEVILFPRGKRDAPNGTARPDNPFCTEAICCLLGVSRNFIYRRKPHNGGNSNADEALVCVVDTAGARLRQHRRMGTRTGFPDVNDLLLTIVDVKYHT